MAIIAPVLILVGLGAIAASAATTCTAQLGDGCGPYTDSSIPMSGGFDTYVSNQAVGSNAGTAETLTATDPGNWSVTANAVPYGYGGVQTFPDSQQLTNDWSATDNTWDGSADTPVDALSSLTVTYSETGPQDANSIYEFAPDLWFDNYGDDVMFWADVHGRCNTGAYGSTVLGTATFDGQTWTVNRYGGPGAEIIFVLDSDPGVPDSCSNQTSGTIDLKAGLDWLVAHGYMTAPIMSQLNTGFEITSADNTTFSMNSYSINAVPNGGDPSPSPSPSLSSSSSSSPGQGSVAYDASSGAKAARAGSLTWTHTVGSGADNALLVEASVGIDNDVNCHQVVTDNGTAMTKLAVVHSNNQDNGYVDAWGLAGVPAGANSIKLTVTGCNGGKPLELTAGAESFTGVSQSAPFSTAVTAYGSGTNLTGSIATTTGDMVAAFLTDGSPIKSAHSPAVSKFTENQDALTGAGDSAGAVNPATSSPVTPGWSLSDDWWGEALLQVQAA